MGPHKFMWTSFIGSNNNILEIRGISNVGRSEQMLCRGAAWILQPPGGWASFRAFPHALLPMIIQTEAQIS